MALPPTAAGASALAATARSRLAPRPRRSAVRGEAPGPTPGMGTVGDATTTMATGSGQVGGPAGAARNALGLKGFRLATGSPTTTMSTMSRSDPAPDSLRSAVEGGGAGGFTGTSVSAPAPGMADRARQALGMEGRFSPREIGGASPFIPESIQADADMRRMTADAPGATIQGRPVNPDGTITGANGGTQQLGNAAMRRLGMPPVSDMVTRPIPGTGAPEPPATPPGLRGFRAATPYSTGPSGGDEMARALDGDPQPAEPPTDAPLPTTFRRRRPDIQIGGGGALGGF